MTKEKLLKNITNENVNLSMVENITDVKLLKEEITQPEMKVVPKKDEPKSGENKGQSASKEASKIKKKEEESKEPNSAEADKNLQQSKSKVDPKISPSKPKEVEQSQSSIKDKEQSESQHTEPSQASDIDIEKVEEKLDKEKDKEDENKAKGKEGFQSSSDPSMSDEMKAQLAIENKSKEDEHREGAKESISEVHMMPKNLEESKFIPKSESPEKKTKLVSVLKTITTPSFLKLVIDNSKYFFNY